MSVLEVCFWEIGFLLRNVEAIGLRITKLVDKARWSVVYKSSLDIPHTDVNEMTLTAINHQPSLHVVTPRLMQRGHLLVGG